MLPPFIIEEIRRREQDRQRRKKWPRVEFPMESPPPGSTPIEPDPGAGHDRDDGGETTNVDYRI